MDFGSQIYIRKDAGAAFMAPDDPLPSVTLIVDGPTTIAPFHMVLPTDGRDRITVHLVWGWLAVLSSPMVAQADMTQEQRTLLLAIACAYSAFLDLQPGVQAEDFDEFTKCLVTLARPLDPLTSAEHGLQAIKVWLESRLPESSFAPVHDDTFELLERVASSKPRQKNLVANLVAMLNSDLREALHGIGNSAPTTTSPPSVEPTGKSTTSASRAQKDRRRCAKQHAATTAQSSGSVSSMLAEDTPPTLPVPATTQGEHPMPPSRDSVPHLPTAIAALGQVLGLDLAEAAATPAGSDSNTSHASVQISTGSEPHAAVTDNGGFCPATVEDAEESASESSDADSDVPSLRTVMDSSNSEEEDSEDDSELSD